MFPAKSLYQNLRHSSVWNPQISFQFLRCQPPIFVNCSRYMFNILRCSACCRPSRPWITFSRFSTIFEAFVPHFYLCCSYSIVPESLLNHLNSFHGGMFRLNAKFDSDLLFYSLSHFECDSHTVHMLIQQHLLPPTDWYSEVILVHACTIQSTLLGCQVTSMSHKPFS